MKDSTVTLLISAVNKAVENITKRVIDGTIQAKPSDILHYAEDLVQRYKKNNRSVEETV